MKFMEKIYRKFCADEVKMMLDHMEENFADFQDYDNRWYDLFNSDNFTTVERAALNLTCRRLKANQKRQELLGAILSQKISPVKHKRREAKQSAQASSLQAQMLAYQQAQNAAQNALSSQYSQYQTLNQFESALQQYKRP
jgi:hypothetical protein